MSVYDDKVASETIQLNQMHIESSIIVPLKNISWLVKLEG